MKFLSFLFLRRLALLPLALAVALAQPAPPAEPPLRRLDNPAAEPAAADKKAEPANKRRVRNVTRDEMPFGNQAVPAGAIVRDAVAIFGAVEVKGVVQGNAVSIGSGLQVAPEGKVRGHAAAVLGRVTLRGETGGNAVSVLGGISEIDGPVEGNAVVVLGSLKLGPKAVIGRDVVVVGGQLIRDPAAIVHGAVHHVSVAGLGDFEWLVTWLRECALLARPLAFHEKLGWAWAIAFGFLGFYCLLALLFGRNVELCVATFERRPAMSILASMLTVLLSPIAIMILALTIVGVLLVPFLTMGLGLFGKAVMLAWLGRRFTKFFGDGPLGGVVFATFMGGLVLMLIYTIPFVGFATYKLVSWLGLGVVMLAIVEAMQRNKRPPAAAASPSPTPPPPAPEPVAAAPIAVPEVPPVAPAPPPVVAGIVAIPPLPAHASRAAESRAALRAAVVDETVLPRANLLLRLAALALDGVLVGVLLTFLAGLLPRWINFHHGPSPFLITLAIYAAVMWTLRGTTIGGIVCGLKVVRLDGRRLDGTAAAVRALGCFLSLVVAGLGFIWVAFDDEQQSWHDKIAGTVVVRVPKGTSLV